MEKLLVICCALFLLGGSPYAQNYEYLPNRIDSISRPYINTFNSDEKMVIENNNSIADFSFLPDKDVRIKKNSRRNEFFVVFNDRGDTQFVGNFRKGRLNGNWQSWYDNRQICDSGILIDNLPDGTWKGWYPNGHTRYILQFSARKLHAVKSELLKQPKTKYFMLATLPPAEAARHYSAQLLFGHKSVDVKSISMNKQINHPVYSLETVKNIVTENTDGDKTSAYKAPFAEGLLHGQFTSFYANGSIKETGLYLNGLREGIWEEYNLRQEKAVGTYRHGYRNGEWRYYNSQGKLLNWKRFDAKGKETEKYSFPNK
jgi:antitoxin component YwqK of YwqJK toxin-antitoxin module